MLSDRFDIRCPADGVYLTDYLLKRRTGQYRGGYNYSTHCQREATILSYTPVYEGGGNATTNSNSTGGPGAAHNTTATTQPIFNFNFRAAFGGGGQHSSSAATAARRASATSFATAPPSVPSSHATPSGTNDNSPTDQLHASRNNNNSDTVDGPTTTTSAAVSRSSSTLSGGAGAKRHRDEEASSSPRHPPNGSGGAAFDGSLTNPTTNKKTSIAPTRVVKEYTAPSHPLASYGDRMIQSMVVARRLKGHSGCINSIEFNEDASLLITGSDDLRVKLYDTTSWKHVGSLTTEHVANIFSAIIMPNTCNRTILSCGLDGAVCVSDLSSETSSVVHRYRFVMATKLMPLYHWGTGHIAIAGFESGDIAFVDTRTKTIPHKAALFHSKGSVSQRVPVNGIAAHPHNPNIFAFATDVPFAQLCDIRYLADNSVDQCKPRCSFAEIGITAPRYRNRGIGGIGFSESGDRLLLNYKDSDLYGVEWLRLASEPSTQFMSEDVRAVFSTIQTASWPDPYAAALQDTLSGSTNNANNKASTSALLSSSLSASPSAAAAASLCDSPNNHKDAIVCYQERKNRVTMFKEATYLYGDNYVCTGSDDGFVYFWDAPTGWLVHKTRCDRNIVNGVLHHPHLPTTLIACGIDSDAKVVQPFGNYLAVTSEKITIGGTNSTTSSTTATAAAASKAGTSNTAAGVLPNPAAASSLSSTATRRGDDNDAAEASSATATATPTSGRDLTSPTARYNRRRDAAQENVVASSSSAPPQAHKEAITALMGYQLDLAIEGTPQIPMATGGAGGRGRGGRNITSPASQHHRLRFWFGSGEDATVDNEDEDSFGERDPEWDYNSTSTDNNADADDEDLMEVDFDGEEVDVDEEEADEDDEPHEELAEDDDEEAEEDSDAHDDDEADAAEQAALFMERQHGGGRGGTATSSSDDDDQDDEWGSVEEASSSSSDDSAPSASAIAASLLGAARGGTAAKASKITPKPSSSSSATNKQTADNDDEDDEWASAEDDSSDDSAKHNANNDNDIASAAHSSANGVSAACKRSSAPASSADSSSHQSAGKKQTKPTTAPTNKKASIPTASDEDDEWESAEDDDSADSSHDDPEDDSARHEEMAEDDDEEDDDEWEDCDDDDDDDPDEEDDSSLDLDDIYGIPTRRPATTAGVARGGRDSGPSHDHDDDDDDSDPSYDDDDDDDEYTDEDDEAEEEDDEDDGADGFNSITSSRTDFFPQFYDDWAQIQYMLYNTFLMNELVIDPIVQNIERDVIPAIQFALDDRNRLIQWLTNISTMRPSSQFIEQYRTEAVPYRRRVMDRVGGAQSQHLRQLIRDAPNNSVAAVSTPPRHVDPNNNNNDNNSNAASNDVSATIAQLVSRIDLSRGIIPTELFPTNFADDFTYLCETTDDNYHTMALTTAMMAAARGDTSVRMGPDGPTPRPSNEEYLHILAARGTNMNAPSLQFNRLPTTSSVNTPPPRVVDLLSTAIPDHGVPAVVSRDPKRIVQRFLNNCKAMLTEIVRLFAVLKLRDGLAVELAWDRVSYGILHPTALNSNNSPNRTGFPSTASGNTSAGASAVTSPNTQQQQQQQPPGPLLSPSQPRPRMTIAQRAGYWTNQPYEVRKIKALLDLLDHYLFPAVRLPCGTANRQAQLLLYIGMYNELKLYFGLMLGEQLGMVFGQTIVGKRIVSRLELPSLTRTTTASASSPAGPTLPAAATTSAASSAPTPPASSSAQQHQPSPATKEKLVPGTASFAIDSLLLWALLHEHHHDGLPEGFQAASVQRSVRQYIRALSARREADMAAHALLMERYQTLLAAHTAATASQSEGAASSSSGAKGKKKQTSASAAAKASVKPAPTPPPPMPNYGRLEAVERLLRPFIDDGAITDPFETR